MNKQNDFKNQCNDEIDQQGKSELLNQLTRQWFVESTKTNITTRKFIGVHKNFKPIIYIE
jgi:hypothetical protein